MLDDGNILVCSLVNSFKWRRESHSARNVFEFRSCTKKEALTVQIGGEHYTHVLKNSTNAVLMLVTCYPFIVYGRPEEIHRQDAKSSARKIIRARANFREEFGQKDNSSQ
jgi:hypothetical protein